MKVLYGDRIGKTAQIRVGASAIIFAENRSKVLLTRRADNGRWCLPSGAIDPGESIEECCIREAWEETGLEVKIVRLVAVYSNPNRVTEYGDGNRWQVIGFSFEAEITGGELGLSDETTEVGYYTLAEMETMDIMEPHFERVKDALLGQERAIVK